MQRNFTFAVDTALGAYTFRTEVVDTHSASDIAWATVSVTNNNPTVSLSLSATAINEGNPVTATATANDVDGTIDRVSFFRDNYLHAIDKEKPFTYTYTPQGTGLRRFQAAVFDNDGGTTTSSVVTLTVNAAPVVTTLSVDDSTPERGATITLTGDYTDSDGNLSSATIHNLGTGDKTGDEGTYPSIPVTDGTASIADSSATLQRDFTFAVDTALGVYTFRTEVVDTNSASDIAWTTVTVQNSNPTVSIAPSAATINEGGSVTVTATVSDVDGTIASVKFYRNDALVETDTTSPYTYTYSSASAGGHAFKAIAVDNDGGSKTSPPVTVTVNTAPVVNAAPVVDKFSVNDTPTPEAGGAISITGTYSDADGNLHAATIRDLGTGDQTGDLGPFPSIGTAGESIEGESDSIERDFTIPPGTANGAYTFRTEVVDTSLSSDIAWKVITVGGSSPVVAVSAPASAVAGSSVTVNISATSSDWNLQRVEIYHNDSQVETLNFSDLATVYEYLNATLGTHRFYAVGLDEDNNRVSSNTAEIEVVDDESDTWPDINGDGYLDQKLAELDRPDRSGEVGRVTDNKVELIIEDQSTYVLDFEHISIDGVPNIINDDYLLASVRFPYLKGYQYQMQYKQFSGDPKTSPPGTPLEGTPWVNWNNLPIPDSPLENRNYILWCDFENLWYNWNNIPQKFRVIRLGGPSSTIGEPSTEDVDGDGDDETIHDVTVEVISIVGDFVNIRASLPNSIINHQYRLQICIDDEAWIDFEDVGILRGNGGIISADTSVNWNLFAKYRFVDYDDAAVLVDIIGHQPGPNGTQISFFDEEDPSKLIIVENDNFDEGLRNPSNNSPQKDSSNNTIDKNKDEDFAKITLKVSPTLTEGTVTLTSDFAPNDTSKTDFFVNIYSEDGSTKLDPSDFSVDLTNPQGELANINSNEGVKILIEGVIGPRISYQFLSERTTGC